MCTIFILRDVVPGYPVVVCGNRDEVLSRPWSPPQLFAPPADQEGAAAALMPVDGVAGGTWIGLNAAGLIVGVTNRIPGSVDRTLPSRGIMAREALHQPDVAAAAAIVRSAVGSSRYNGFNVVLADARATCLMTLEPDVLREQTLEGPIHVVTSLHDLDPPVLMDLRMELLAAARSAPDLPALVPEVRRVLADHEPRGPLYSVCKHADLFGTRSAAVLALSEEGRPQMWFAPGPPCVTDFAPVPASFG